MLGRGVVDEELPSDAPDQRRGTSDVEDGSKVKLHACSYIISLLSLPA